MERCVDSAFRHLRTKSCRVRRYWEAIYEPKFKEFSFGFRPNRSCHDAIQRVNKHIMADKVNYILDADIKGFFDNIDHEWMIKFLEHDIADKNFIRYSKRNVKIYLKLKIGRKNAIVLEKWNRYTYRYKRGN